MGSDYWIIDVLPCQVRPEFGESYSVLEEYCLKDGRVHERFRELLLKLGCYFRVEVRENDGGDIEAVIGEAVITLDRDDAYMTLYEASDELLEMVKVLAGAGGLFVWKPPQ
ncbi:MAG: hypothetical protein IJS39_00410 [Synergistaceae bacterium]|nr:hypothetical protein [Synergistaceae bacterium]